jgi:GMP synthase (glutamine-hydrolysing)
MAVPLNILCIQNDTIGPAGLIAEQLFRRNGNLDVVMPHDGDGMPAEHAPYDGVLVMGGAMDAFDDENYPQFWPMIRLLRGFHAAGKPILGVCLGAQLVARVFEKLVYRHHELELGFTEVDVTDAGAASPLLAGAARKHWVMEWHQDTFDLPEGAELLITGKRCRNQAFRIANAYAFQFHFEVTRPMVRQWGKVAADFLKREHPDFLARIEHDCDLHMAKQTALARQIADRWLDIAEAGGAVQPSLAKAGLARAV